MIRLRIILRSRGTPCPLTPPPAWTGISSRRRFACHSEELQSRGIRESREGSRTPPNHQSLALCHAERGRSFARERPAESKHPYSHYTARSKHAARADVQEPSRRRAKTTGGISLAAAEMSCHSPDFFDPKIYPRMALKTGSMVDATTSWNSWVARST